MPCRGTGDEGPGGQVGRSKRDRRRRKQNDLIVLVPAGFLGYALFAPKWGPVLYSLILAVVIMVWILFFMDTRCDYQTDKGSPCTREVYGKVRGCRQFHSRLKTDAIYAALRMRNPGMVFRVMWFTSGSQGQAFGATSTAQAAALANQSQGVGSLIMIVFTIIGAVASALALLK